MKRILALVLLASIAFAQDVTPTGQQVDGFSIKKTRGGAVISTDYGLNGQHVLRSKPVYGADSSFTDVSPANPMPVWGGVGFALNVSAGNVSGMSSVDKFGRNIEIDSGVTADVWDGGKTVGALPAGSSLIWVAPTQARVHNIASTSIGDASGSAGAKTIRVYGLPRWTSAEISEVITMNGQNNVATDSSYVIIHRMEVLTKGANGPNIGTITATAVTDGTVTARIEVTKGQTQMAIYGIPSIQTAYIGLIYGYANKAAGAAALADIALLVNPEPDAELISFLIKFPFGLQTVGTSGLPVPFYTPKKVVGPAIIKMQVVSGTNDMDVTAGFDIILVNN